LNAIVALSWVREMKRVAQQLQMLRGLGFVESIGQGNQRSATP
jgi:hypothetical protein